MKGGNNKSGIFSYYSKTDEIMHKNSKGTPPSVIITLMKGIFDGKTKDNLIVIDRLKSIVAHSVKMKYRLIWLLFIFVWLRPLFGRYHSLAKVVLARLRYDNPIICFPYESVKI